MEINGIDMLDVDKLKHCPNCDRYLYPSDFVGVYCKRCDDLTKQEFDPSVTPKAADREPEVKELLKQAESFVMAGHGRVAQGATHRHLVGGGEPEVRGHPLRAAWVEARQIHEPGPEGGRVALEVRLRGRERVDVDADAALVHLLNHSQQNGLYIRSLFHASTHENFLLSARFTSRCDA